MKANELRIGNIIKNKNSICIVCGILNESDLFVNNEYEEWYPDLSECTPIPLTEEWLLKFGFEKEIVLESTKSIFYTKGEITLFYYIDYNVFKFDMLIINDGIEIKSVNKLQNLYFTLTEEELTLNDKL